MKVRLFLSVLMPILLFAALLTAGCAHSTAPVSPPPVPAPSPAPGTPPAPPSAATPPASPAPGATPSAPANTPAAPTPAKGEKSGAAPIVTMVTTKGTILIKLFPKEAPLTVANFEKLVKQGFYNGLMFHRVADLGAGPGQGHIVQGGDPNSRHAQVGDPSLGKGGPGYTIKGEFAQNGVNNPLKHVAGAVAMARSSDPNSGGSQFYIVVTPAPDLDGSYAVFGQVIQGMEVAKNLQVGDRMTKVTLK